MSRIAIPARADAPSASQPLLDAVEAKLGAVPNLFRLVSLSPAALEGFLGFNAALGRVLNLATRERIALAVAQANDCDYCLAAHSYLGLNLAKLDPDEIDLNRQGRSGDGQAGPAVAFAVKAMVAHGQVSDADLAAVRAAGYADAQIVEIVALVAENVFTNFLNKVAQTEIDFPAVPAYAAA